jgi:glutamine amidotransferase
MITIVDYGMGNLGSMLNMFKRIGVDVRVDSEPDLILEAEKLVLPGVGAFDTAMRKINDVPKLQEALERQALVNKVPVLGVCLGMQLLTTSSEEGLLAGLGWIPAKTQRFPRIEGLKVPHMGWNIATPNFRSSLTDGIDTASRYYFIHSYYVQVVNSEHSLMRTNYGITFDSAIGYENIYGVQFHPEKSHKFGMQILKNFSEL